MLAPEEIICRKNYSTSQQHFHILCQYIISDILKYQFVGGVDGFVLVCAKRIRKCHHLGAALHDSELRLVLSRTLAFVMSHALVA